MIKTIIFKEINSITKYVCSRMYVCSLLQKIMLERKINNIFTFLY